MAVDRGRQFISTRSRVTLAARPADAPLRWRELQAKGRAKKIKPFLIACRVGLISDGNTVMTGRGLGRWITSHTPDTAAPA